MFGTAGVDADAYIWRRSTDLPRSPISEVPHESWVRPTTGSPWTSLELTRGHRAARTAAGAMSALPGPEQAEAAPMPGEDRRRLHDKERRAPGAPSVRQPHPQHAINSRQAKAWMARSIRDGQLVPQREDLQVQRRACTNQEPE